MKELSQQDGEFLNKLSARKDPTKTIWWEWENVSGMFFTKRCNICGSLFASQGNVLGFIEHGLNHINESNLKAFL